MGHFFGETNLSDKRSRTVFCSTIYHPLFRETMHEDDTAIEKEAFADDGPHNDTHAAGFARTLELLLQFDTFLIDLSSDADVSRKSGYEETIDRTIRHGILQREVNRRINIVSLENFKRTFARESSLPRDYKYKKMNILGGIMKKQLRHEIASFQNIFI